MYHVPEQFNVFADLLIRWGARVEHLNRTTPIILTSQVQKVMTPATSTYFSWPTRNCNIAAQRRAIGKQPRLADHLYVADGLIFHSKTRRIWIPSSSLKLKLNDFLSPILFNRGTYDFTPLSVELTGRWGRDLSRFFKTICGKARDLHDYNPTQHGFFVQQWRSGLAIGSTKAFAQQALWMKSKLLSRTSPVTTVDALELARSF